jgi:hypothetical protein
MAIMSFLLISPTVLGLGAFSLTILYAVYRAALPRPIPGIPYNKTAATSILGDMPEFLKYVKGNNGQALGWWSEQIAKHDSPICQLFLKPLGRPIVIVSDFREAQDVLLRRHKEFDRSTVFDDVFSGVMPYHHIGQKTSEKVKAQKRLLADTMMPSFLNEVSAPDFGLSCLGLLMVGRSPLLASMKLCWISYAYGI